ncbi:helix-turn-helix transcriptional regulator [Hathewaya histolytica]|uniref:XRE family transcriptional regulator n=1 Tax=Hathewaya histolytica TaxID=1498 RepID=A0A4U9R9U8_HATHI|nr:helix-turn-helix transcriptional regulator [Hathewaya histolytica]VTQ88382.1 XRE family transcriptional regulator [Hathewaya histolytica]
MNINLLKSQRVKNGLTQKDVANTLDIDVTTYSKKENGLISFKASEIKELKYLLKLTPEIIDEIFFINKVELNSIKAN